MHPQHSIIRTKEDYLLGNKIIASHTEQMKNNCQNGIRLFWLTSKYSTTQLHPTHFGCWRAGLIISWILGSLLECHGVQLHGINSVNWLAPGLFGGLFTALSSLQEVCAILKWFPFSFTLLHYSFQLRLQSAHFPHVLCRCAERLIYLLLSLIWDAVSQALSNFCLQLRTCWCEVYLSFSVFPSMETSARTID